eukprot:3503374-Amphidinium_carterae.1
MHVDVGCRRCGVSSCFHVTTFCHRTDIRYVHFVGASLCEEGCIAGRLMIHVSCGLVHHPGFA